MCNLFAHKYDIGQSVFVNEVPHPTPTADAKKTSVFKVMESTEPKCKLRLLCTITVCYHTI